MRVRTPSNLFTYPDALVVCDEPVFLDERETPCSTQTSSWKCYRPLLSAMIAD